MKDLKSRMETKDAEVQALQSQLKEANEKNISIDSNLKEAKSSMEKSLRESDTLSQKANKLGEELEQQLVNTSQLTLENNGLQEDSKRKQIEINKLSLDCELQKRKLDKERKAGQIVHEQVHESKTINQNLNNQIIQIQKEL